MSFENFSTFIPQLITAIATLSGVIVSGYFMSLNAKRSAKEQRQLKIDERRIDRLEELYLVFHRWQKMVSNCYLTSTKRHKGLLTRAEENKVVAEIVKDSIGDIDRINMLVNIHFPEMKASFQKVLDAKSKNSAYLQDVDSKIDIQQFFREQELFWQCCRDFEEKLAQLPKAVT